MLRAVSLIFRAHRGQGGGRVSVCRLTAPQPTGGPRRPRFAFPRFVCLDVLDNQPWLPNVTGGGCTGVSKWWEGGRGGGANTYLLNQLTLSSSSLCFPQRGPSLQTHSGRWWCWTPQLSLQTRPKRYFDFQQIIIYIILYLKLYLREIQWH